MNWYQLRMKNHNVIVVAFLIAGPKLSGTRNSLRDIRVSPLNGLRVLIVFVDISHELAAKFLRRSKDPASDRIPLDFGEPELHLVEPRRVGGGVVKMDIPVVGQELPDAFGLMSREVIRNDVNLSNFMTPKTFAATATLFAGLALSRTFAFPPAQFAATQQTGPAAAGQQPGPGGRGAIDPRVQQRIQICGHK
jgi:hypothetical protein